MRNRVANSKIEEGYLSNIQGFTLIELLAVIVIIGLLAVLIIPKVSRTIRESRNNINKASAAGLQRVAENYYMEQKTINRSFQGCSYDFTNNTNTCVGLEFSGELPETGKLSIDIDGKIGFAAKFDDICYVKKYNLDSLITIENSEINCGENTYFIPQVVSTGDGLYKSETDTGRLIYRGLDPDNYISLKENNVDTMYRIVSFENDGTIKVVRDEKIDVEMAWDARDENDITTGPRHNANNTYCNFTQADGKYCGCGVWGNQENTYYNGKTLSELNQDFYFYYYPNSQATNFSIKINNYFGTVSQDSTINTYLNTIFYNTVDIKNKIDAHQFNVGGVHYYDEYNGRDKGLLKEKQEEQVYTWNGKIGLLDITEYVESSLESSCTSVYSNDFYNPDNQIYSTSDEWPCKYENFNYKNYNQWSISSNAYYRSNIWIMVYKGYFDYYQTRVTDIGFRPAFYLKPDIILSGSGTESNPYMISNV